MNFISCIALLVLCVGCISTDSRALVEDFETRIDPIDSRYIIIYIYRGKHSPPRYLERNDGSHEEGSKVGVADLEVRDERRSVPAHARGSSDAEGAR